jgi:hypothetical protein
MLYNIKGNDNHSDHSGMGIGLNLNGMGMEYLLVKKKKL